MVDFVEDVVQETVPEVTVSGVAAVERISDNLVRVTYYKCRKGERESVIHLIWDRDEWLRQWHVWDTMRELISDDAFEIAVKNDQRRDVH